MPYNTGPNGELLLGASEYSERLMRALALKGDLPQYLLPQYLLTMQQEDLSKIEFSWLRRTARYMVGGTSVAVAAQFGIFAFGGQNVQGRNTMAIIDTVAITNISGAALRFDVAAATLAGLGGVALTRFGQNMDDRQFRQSQSAYACGFGSNAVSPAPGQAWNVTVPAGAIYELPWLPTILTNVDNGTFASGFVIAAGTVNAAFTVGITWRERQLQDSELL